MKHKLLFQAAALLLAATLAGCGAQTAGSSRPPVEYISMESARTAALTHAQAEAANTLISSTTLADVAGITCYKVVFTYNGYTYSYSVDAQTGEVLEAGYRERVTSQTVPEVVNPSLQDDPTMEIPETVTPAPSTDVSAGIPLTTEWIGEERAKEIALASAGVNAEDATFTKCVLDIEDRLYVYEIEWYVRGVKYEYDIIATDGTVYAADYEVKNELGDGNGTAVNAEVAKQTALARVPGATKSDIYEWESDYDDGYLEYEGKIIYNGREYEFTINANTGKIVEWEEKLLRT